MSIVLQSTGGGSVTINEPSTASNFTQTLPAATGTVMVSGNQPAFSAYQTATTSLSNNAFTKVLFDTEEFDTNSCFTSSTFTPTVAGYYQINAYVGTGTNSNMMICSIFKNNAEYKRGTTAVSNSMYNSSCCSVVYFNGTTDYVDIRGYQNSGGAQNTSTGITGSFVNACMVRGV